MGDPQARRGLHIRGRNGNKPSCRLPARLVPVVVNPEFPLNTLLFFLTPQRIVPLKAAGGGMPFGVRETALGVWADGCILGLESRKSGRAALLEGGLRVLGPLLKRLLMPTARWRTRTDPNQFQMLTEDSSR